MPVKSALFLDFDNVFITLQKFSYDLAARFAAKPQVWMKAVEHSLGLGEGEDGPARRLLLRRCYASPDNIYRTRYNYTQAGLEVVDCPPLTRRMKNGADISIVMDVMDTVTRFAHIEEYIILSADADFVPVLHRLRKEMKRSVIFTSFDTASAYKNCADQTLDAEFFRRCFEQELVPVRRPAIHPESQAGTKPVELPADFWAKVESSLRKAATKRLGHLPFATAAQELRSELADLLGDNWAGFGKFSDLMAAAPAFDGFITDQETLEYRIEGFRLDLTSWGEAGEGDMVEFVTDILSSAEKRLPFLPPDAYTAIFEGLAEAFAEGAESLTDAVSRAQTICKEAGHNPSVQEIRFICVGVSSQGCTLDNTSDGKDFANAWRINVWDLCDQLEWMLEPDEALMLATWFHAKDETPEQGAAEFIELTAPANQGDAPHPDQA